MTADYLERITLNFPQDEDFIRPLFSMLGELGQSQADRLQFPTSEPDFYPRIALQTCPEASGITANFALSNGEVLSIAIINSTGQSRTSPHVYRRIPLEQVQQRLTALDAALAGIDHVGFNLPWFEAGLHPDIERLRETLGTKCLYHRFPSGEPWDFILPGDLNEIAARKPVDYARKRRTKFELVSFDKTSTPLIQLDVNVRASYEQLAPLFPEALNDPQYRNLWLYLENSYPIDVCLVVNEVSEGDWSGFFRESRL